MIQEAKLKLSFNEEDTLKDLVHTGQINAVLKIMEHYATQQEQSLVSFQYKPGQEQELVNKKAAALGARHMFNAIKRHLEKIKGSKLL